MIKRDVSPESWAFRHGLRLVSYACPVCTNMVYLNQPVQTKDWVGFEGFCTGCNPPNKMSYLKPIKGLPEGVI